MTEDRVEADALAADPLQSWQDWFESAPIGLRDWQTRAEWGSLRNAISRGHLRLSADILILLRRYYQRQAGGSDLPSYRYSSSELLSTFEKLRDEWREDTLFTSSGNDLILHPAYQRIIGLGRQALPLILRELEERPAPWFWALAAISGENPADSSATFDDQVKAWTNWGRQSGYLA